MLHENCLLVSLKISMPPQTKIAKQASDDVEHRYRTAKKQGKVTKHLFSQQDIKPLTQIMSKARTTFNEISLPYDNAYRIIPSSSYFDFVSSMSELSKEFDAKKQEFLRAYHIITMRAERDLGDLYNPDDYPTPERLKQMISFTVESSVVPPMTAFDELAGLTPEAIEELKAQAAAGQKEKVEQALGDLFKRLFTSLNKAKSKLADEDSIFRDTLIGNIHAALDAIDTLNLTNNQELIDLATEVRGVIEGIQPDDLRRDKELRKQTAESTKELLNKMSEFF